VSVSTYDSVYIFDSLTPGWQYYVVMGHVSENENGDLARTLDDYIKVHTKEQNNDLTISYINREGNSANVGVRLSLESMNAVSGGDAQLVLYPDTGSPQSSLLGEIHLDSDDIRLAASDAFTAVIGIGDYASFAAGEYLNAALLDSGGGVVLTARAYNQFYEAP
jgi:hypothetical protein